MLQVSAYNNSVNIPQIFPKNNGNFRTSFSGKDYDTIADENKNYERTAIIAGLLQLFSSSLNKLSGWLGNKLAKGKEFAAAEDVERVANDMIKNKKLNTTVEYISPENLREMNWKYKFGNELNEVAAGKNAFFMSEKKLAVAPKNKPSLILHELGHAGNATSKFWKIMQKSRRFTPYAPVAALILSKIKTKDDGRPNFVERNAGKLGFCAFLPTIIEEGKASLRGISQAKKTLASEIKSGRIKLGALKRNYFIAFLTYVLAGIGLGVATKYAVIENRFNKGSQI